MKEKLEVSLEGVWCRGRFGRYLQCSLFFAYIYFECLGLGIDGSAVILMAVLLGIWNLTQTQKDMLVFGWLELPGTIVLYSSISLPRTKPHVTSEAEGIKDKSIRTTLSGRFAFVTLHLQ